MHIVDLDLETDPLCISKFRINGLRKVNVKLSSAKTNIFNEVGSGKISIFPRLVFFAEKYCESFGTLRSIN